MYFITIIGKKEPNVNPRTKNCNPRTKILELKKQQELSFIHCQWVCKMVEPLWKTGWQFLIKLNIFLAYNPAIIFLGISKGVGKLHFQRSWKLTST